MTPLEQLKTMLPERYHTYKNEEYTIELMPGLSDEEIDTVARQLPGRQVPAEIRELLQFTSGFLFFGLDAITFDGVREFDMLNLIPFPVRLAGDGYGNYFVVDVDRSGKWGPVLYVLNDPQVIIKHSENVTEFLQDIHAFGKRTGTSTLDVIHNSTMEDIWERNNGFITHEDARYSNDPQLEAFARQIPRHYMIADLRDKAVRSGFAWGKFGTNMRNAIRDRESLIWGIERKPPQQRRPPFNNRQRSFR